MWQNFTLVVAVRLLSSVWLFVTLWTTACQVSMLTIFWSLFRLMSIELMIQPIHPLTALFSCPQFSPTLESFPVSQDFASSGQSIGALASTSVLPVNAAAKLLQSCPTLCDPIDSSPPGSPILGILKARTLEWVAISFSNVWKWKVKAKSLSHVRLVATRWTAAYQAPPSMGFSRQEYWSGVFQWIFRVNFL